jgi:2-methylisocitrate lyase-like PEP mutase family enzyme
MKRKTWKELLDRDTPLLLPAAHDALTARLIEQAGFEAYQVGGFALSAAYFALPDLGLTCWGEELNAIWQIMQGSKLPILVDADDGYGDVKNVTRTVQGYEDIGASAMFFEDQAAPKRCGHLSGKKLLPTEDAENKIKAAVSAKQNPDTFIIARTDAVAVEGLDAAIERAKKYTDAGADAIYVEAVEDLAGLRKVGNALKGTPLAISYMTGGGKMPWVRPLDLYNMGYAMILYSTSVLFPVVNSIQKSLSMIKAGMDVTAAVSLNKFEKVIGMERWEEIEKQFPAK